MSDAYERAVELYRADHLTEMRDLFFRLALNRLPPPLLQELIAVMEHENTAAVREALGKTDAAVGLNREAVSTALRQVIGYLDYDLAKQLDHDEVTGEDTWGEHVDRFITGYDKAVES